MDVSFQAEGGEVDADLVASRHCDGPGAVAVVGVVVGEVRGCQHTRLRHQSTTTCCTHRSMNSAKVDVEDGSLDGYVGG